MVLSYFKADGFESLYSILLNGQIILEKTGFQDTKLLYVALLSNCLIRKNYKKVVYGVRTKHQISNYLL